MENHVSMFIMVWSFWSSMEGGGEAYSREQLLIVSTSAWLLWLVGAGTVLGVGGNRGSFFSSLTARGFLEEMFYNGSDATKCGFGVHPSLIGAKLREDTQRWIDAGWEGWLSE